MSVPIICMPSEVGQRVRLRGYGGEVAMWMETGAVVRFNRSGFPVVEIDPMPSRTDHGRQVTDRYGCFGVVDAEGRWVYEPSDTDGPSGPASVR